MKKLILVLAISCSFVAVADNTQKIGSWWTKTEANKITDEIDFVAINLSPDTYNKDGYTRETRLVLRCSNNKTDAYLSFHDYMGSDDPVITMRLDGGKPTKRTWNGGEGGDSAFSPKPIQFIKGLTNHKKAIFGFEPYGTTMQVVEFDISGVDEITKKLSSSCKWK